MLLQLILQSIPIEKLAEGLVEAAFPAGPRWLSSLIGSMTHLVQEIVEELTSDEYSGLSGAEKLALVVATVRSELDEGFDDMPQWGDMDEAARDRIIGGLAELTLFIYRLTSTSDRREQRRIQRRTQRRLRRSVRDVKLKS